MEVLQTSALPLGYVAFPWRTREREWPHQNSLTQRGHRGSVSSHVVGFERHRRCADDFSIRFCARVNEKVDWLGSGRCQDEIASHREFHAVRAQIAEEEGADGGIR